VHTEAVQAVLARHVERKVAVPMPSKRRSLVVQTSMDAYTPPGLSPLCSDSSSGSEGEAGPGDDMSAMEHWMSRPSHLGPAHLGSTSSSSSSTQSGGSGNAGRLADSLAHTHISHLAHTHMGHTHLGQLHHQQSHLSQSHHGISHLSLKRKGALSVAENGGSLRRSCEFGSDMLWPPPLESD
ncbi:disco-interacting protein 2 homolog C-like, partial [Notothenia coriiceps]|uniref:Disco-interacting protein 2 homolog C-like n=2 Tax=Nototheniidae TaxID=8206 RepID=A0A6I9P9F4_9TELE